MARSFSNIKVLSATIADGISRRGFSAMASQGGIGGVVRGNTNTKTRPVVATVEVKKEETVSPWVPDPVTGYYRPENRAAEVDVAELRQILLNQKKN